jgi:hypothetical protein
VAPQVIFFQWIGSNGSIGHSIWGFFALAINDPQGESYPESERVITDTSARWMSLLIHIPFSS